MNIAGPDVLGIPAPAGVVTALSVAANAIVWSWIVLAAGLVVMMVVMRIHRKRLEFLLELRGTIESAFLPALTFAVAGIFLSLLLEYLTPGHAFSLDSFPLLPLIARIVFIAGISLAAGGAFITIANHMRDGDERATVFGFRIVCGAIPIASFARIADIWLISAHHPANPDLSGIIIVGALIAAAIIGTAILGILRPRLPVWSIAMVAALFIGIAASCYVGIHLADEAYRATAPTFGSAYRIQSVLMILFFACCSVAVGVLALVGKWWLGDSMPEKSGCRIPDPGCR